MFVAQYIEFEIGIFLAGCLDDTQLMTHKSLEGKDGRFS